MRRLRALVAGLPADAAIWRQQLDGPSVPRATQQRRTSSLDEIRKAGGKVIEFHRDRAG